MGKLAVMAQESRAKPTQKTQPRKKGAKPVEIPVPVRKDVFDLMRAVSGKRSANDSGSKQ